MSANLQMSLTGIDGLLLRWEELRSQGQSLSPEELAADAPELIHELAGRITALRAVDAMLAAGPSRNDARRVGLGWSPVDDAPPPGTGRAFSAVVRMVEAQFLARGGLGEVLVARQDELGRRVAVKRIRPDKFHPVARRRFLREAAITAGLQHPGVVPIYALGEDDDGPFYMMPFVQGRTLEEEIGRFHEGAAGLEPGQRAVEFRGLLQRLVAVCETIAYAHDRGVVHRDLKPSNIMLGPYGETLVMDWGLAKHYTSGDEAAESDSEDASPNPDLAADHLTATGAVLGTPRYMSPEQASGGPTGPASDVFSLGVILRAILGGHSWSVASDDGADHNIGTARSGAGWPRRRSEAGVPAALAGVCSKAMAAGPRERYESPRALAADLTRWLAGEPVTAYPEPIMARLRRWVRRHPQLVTSVAAASMVAAMALVALTTVISASSRRLERTNKDLDAARTEAEARSDQARDVTACLVSSFRKPDPAQDGRTVTVAQVLGGAVQELDARPTMATATRVSILDAIGQTYRGLGMVRESVEIAERASGLSSRELGVDHPETLRSTNNLALAYLDATRFDRAIPLLERTLELQSARLGEDHPDRLRTMSSLALAYTEAGQPDRAIPLQERALARQRAQLDADHPDVLTSMNNLALAFKRERRLDRAIPIYEQALEAMRARLGTDDLRTIGTMNNLAAAYLAAGQASRAVTLQEQVLEAARAKLGDDHLLTFEAMNNLARGYSHVGQPGRAIPILEEVLKKQRVKLGEGHLHTLTTMSNLAQDYCDAGRLDLAISMNEQALRAQRLHLGEDHDLTIATISELAYAYKASGRLDLAIPMNEQALQKRRTKFGPDHPVTLTSMNNLAAALREVGRLDEAIPINEEALQRRRATLGADHPDTLITQRNLAQAYERAGHYQDAEPLFRKTIEAAGRSGPRPDRFYADSLYSLGTCLVRQRKHAEAEPVLRDCLTIKVKTQPDDWTTANTRSFLGEALVERKAFGEAEPLLLAGEKALAEHPEKFPPLNREAMRRTAVDRLVRLYEAWGKPAEAEAWKKRRPAAPSGRPEPDNDPKPK